MTKEDFTSQIEELKRKHEQEEITLMRKCAFENNTVKIGEIFEDHIGKIRVDNIGLAIDRSFPKCRYYGAELRKDGTPKLNGAYRWAYESNKKK